MTTIIPPHSAPLQSPAARRWTAEEYLRLAELGFFHGQRTELIDGEIIEMSPIHNAHAAAVYRLARIFGSLPEEQYWVRTQATLELGGNYPEPDVAIVPGPITVEGTFPKSALLIVEVSDATLRFDRGRKMSLYASAGIPEYWVADVAGGCLEVYRQPVVASDEPFGWRYQDVSRLSPADAISPLFTNTVQVRASDIFRRS